MADKPATFRSSTDELLNGVTYEEMAKALGCSVPSLKQARQNPTALSFRSPPQNWEVAVAKLAEKQAAHFAALAKRLRARTTAPARV